MVLEHAHGAFLPIAGMHVWRDELEGGISLEGDCFFMSGAGFVIQDLEINGEPTSRQMSHDCVVGCNAVVVTLGLEGLLEDEVVFCMVGNHDILVAGASSDREGASVDGEELAEWFCYDEDLVGTRYNGRRQRR